MSSHNSEQIKFWASRIKLSDRKAFEQFFRYLYPKLISYAMKFIKEKPAANDVVQEAFVAFWQMRNTIKPEQSIVSYMYRAVRNRSLNRIEKKSNQAEPLDDITLKHHPVEFKDDRQNGELETIMNRWISNLPNRQQEAFRLSRFDGLDHAEIAEVMDVSEKTVNNHIVAALSFLREKYEEYKKLNKQEKR